MKETAKLQIKIIKIDLIILSVLIIISFVFLENPLIWAKGYIFGGLIGILNFMLLAKTMEKSVTMHPAKARSYASVHYFIRYAIVGVVIIIALKADYLNALAVIIGLLLIKFIILFTNLFNNKEYYKRIFKRKGER